MVDSGKAGAVEAQKERKHHRSEIEFPYSDLESAVELAQTIVSKAGSSCETDELAAWMGQTATGGTFRTRVGAARMFGLIETGQGRVAITQLGRDVLNPDDERAARVSAFLKVELFNVMYDKYKGNMLPPPPAIERQMQELGVSPKQKERARQTFMKSATYAGFIDSTSGRFVKPGIVAKEEAPRIVGEQEVPFGSGDGGGPNDPVLKALIQKLPKQGPWSSDERANWMRMMTMAFDMAYGPGDWVIQIDKRQ
jgi:hypothetical protein